MITEAWRRTEHDSHELSSKYAELDVSGLTILESTILGLHSWLETTTISAENSLAQNNDDDRPSGRPSRQIQFKLSWIFRLETITFSTAPTYNCSLCHKQSYFHTGSDCPSMNKCIDERKNVHVPWINKTFMSLFYYVCVCVGSFI